MRLAWTVGVCLVGGCGLVSGLDNLTVDAGDASTAADSAHDTTVDVTDAGDAMVDAGMDAEVGPDGCSRNGNNPDCFGKTCAQSEQCCITPGDASCVSGNGSCSGALLACTDVAVCDGGKCCLENYAVSTSTCPYQLTPSGGMLKSVCGSCGGPDSGVVRICNDDGDCPGGFKCYAVTFAANMSPRFGICM
jgi:hypothetical protein